jgi:hypothetical protein
MKHIRPASVILLVGLVLALGTYVRLSAQSLSPRMYLPLASSPPLLLPTEVWTPTFVATWVPPTLEPLGTIAGAPTWTPIASSTARPATSTPGALNMVCTTERNTELCAWVSNTAPEQSSSVTVYGRLLVNGAGQSGETMNTTWNYRTTDSTCNSTTGSDGVASCSLAIGNATVGFQVNIEVTVDNLTVITWFTPQ